MCPDRQMLTHRYYADLRVYADAARSLARSIGGNFAEAFRRAVRARLVFERARDQLNQHISRHHCSDLPEPIQ